MNRLSRLVAFSVLLAFLSCCLDDKTKLVLDASPWLKDLPAKAETAPVLPTGAASADLENLHIVVPENMKVSMEHLTPAGKTEQKPFLRVSYARGEAGPFDVFCVPYTGDLYVSPGVAAWCSDFPAFRGTFVSDWEMMVAALSSTPRDAESALSEGGRKRAMTLLMLKKDRVLPATLLELPELRLFYSRVPSSGSLLCEVFDKAGRWRCGLTVRPPAAVRWSPKEEVDVLSRLLYYSHF
jgi:hypothetical protein